MALSVFLVGGKISFKPFSVRGTGETISNSITFNSFSDVNNIAQCTTGLKNGGSIKAYSTRSLYNGDVIVNSTNFVLFAYVNNGVNNSILSINETNRECAPFQNLKSIKVAYTGSSGLIVNYSSNGTSWSTATLFNNYTNFTIDGSKYLYLSNPSGSCYPSSITLSYECTPGADPEPEPISYDISYVVLNSSHETVGMNRIIGNSLTTSAVAGTSVEFTPVASVDYVYFDAIEYGEDYISDFSCDSSGEITFTMPSCDVTIGLYVDAELSSIEITDDPTTEYNVDDEVVFDGEVTAHYSDESTADVSSSVVVSSYDTSTEGSHQVTISYTEHGISKTTTYTIDVSEGEEPVTPSDTLNCTYSITQSSSYHYRFEFKNDLTGTYYKFATGDSTKSQIIYFTYYYTASTGSVIITAASDTTYTTCWNHTTGYRLLPANNTDKVIEDFTNSSGVVKANNTFEIDMYRYTSSGYSTESKTYTKI